MRGRRLALTALLLCDAAFVLLVSLFGGSGVARGMRMVNVAAAGNHALPATVVGFITVGQSNSVGAYGLEAGVEVDASANYANLELWDTSGLYAGDAAATTLTLAPLFAPVRANYYDGGLAFLQSTWASGYGSTSCADYPRNLCGITADVRGVDEATLLLKSNGYANFRYLVSNVGRNGYCLYQIGRGSASYNGMLYEVAAAARLVAAGVPAQGIESGSTYIVGAIGMIHGECDYDNSSYASQVQTFQEQAQEDLQAITGQTRQIPLILAQQSAFGLDLIDYSSTQQVIAGQGGADGGILFGGGTYAEDYSPLSGADNGHRSTLGYEQMGEAVFGKWLSRMELYFSGAAAWPTPFAPLHLNITSPDSGTFVHSGNTLTIRMNVPYGPVVQDSTYPNPHQSGAYASYFSTGGGWELWEGTGAATDGGMPQSNGTPVQITGLTWISNPSGPDVQAVLQLTAASSAFDTVAYAQSADSMTGGAGYSYPAGRVGQFRDSDCTITVSGRCNYNEFPTFYQGGL